MPETLFLSSKFSMISQIFHLKYRLQIYYVSPNFILSQMANFLQSIKCLFDPKEIKANVAFFLAATPFLSLVGLMMKAEVFPSLAETSLSQQYSPWSTIVPLHAWMRLAFTLSFILPLVVLLFLWQWDAVRRMLLLYVGLLLAQIPSELLFTKLGLPGMNFVVGFTYTSFRIWQLCSYARWISRQKQSRTYRRNVALLIFVSGIVFWIMNWFFLAINLLTRSVGTSLASYGCV